MGTTSFNRVGNAPRVDGETTFNCELTGDDESASLCAATRGVSAADPRSTAVSRWRVVSPSTRGALPTRLNEADSSPSLAPRPSSLSRRSNSSLNNETSSDNSNVRPGASPRQNGIVGGAP